MPKAAKNFEVTVDSVRPHLDAVPIRTGEHTCVPSDLTAVVTTNVWPKFEVRVKIAHSGRAALVGMTMFQPDVGGEPLAIVTSILRRLPIETMLHAVMKASTGPLDVPEAVRVDRIRGAAYRGGCVRDRAAWAADIYRRALATGNYAPTEAVAVEIGVSHSMASRYVRAARDAGLLDAAPPNFNGRPLDAQLRRPRRPVSPVGEIGIQDGNGMPLDRAADSPIRMVGRVTNAAE